MSRKWILRAQWPPSELYVIVHCSWRYNENKTGKICANNLYLLFIVVVYWMIYGTSLIMLSRNQYSCFFPDHNNSYVCLLPLFTCLHGFSIHGPRLSVITIMWISIIPHTQQVIRFIYTKSRPYLLALKARALSCVFINITSYDLITPRSQCHINLDVNKVPFVT